MKCPYCGTESIVLQTRGNVTETFVWRRRICENGHRFSTNQEPGEPERAVKKPEEYARGK